MESSYRIAAVIINYKTPELCLQAVRSLYMELDAQLDSIVVVDNCSEDGSFQFLQQALATEDWSGYIEIMQSDFNGGFSYGNNFVMSRINAQAYLLLNSDALVKPEAVKTMWKVMQDDPKIGLLGPLVEDEEGNTQESSFVDRSPWNEFLDTAKTGLFTKLFAYLGVRDVAMSTDKLIDKPDWLSFVCVLIRGSAYQQIGPMDDGYFMYKEDNDYCRRTRAKGWGIRYLSEAHIIHLNNGWSSKETARKPSFFYQSRTRYFRKYYGFSGFILANVLWTLGRLIHFLREILQRKPVSVAACAWRDIWTFAYGSKPINYYK